MMTNVPGDDYYQSVILRWDEASGSFKEACKEGNKSSLAYQNNLLNNDWSISIDHEQTPFIEKIVAAVESIDGVGTKVQIYTNQFENIFQAREKKEIDWEEAKKQATELWFRMLMDLKAMNADDLRGGEIAIGVTNIIDINHLTWARWHLFQDSMSLAMKRAIQTTKIAMTAGETAVLWSNAHAKYAQKTIKQLLKALEGILVQDTTTNKRALELTQEWVNMIEAKLEQIDFNIWGTTLGFKTETPKLINLENYTYYDIIAFEEKNENGIIGPRSNGITKIRESMEQIMGDWRENKTFEDFMNTIDSSKQSKIPERVIEVCTGKKLRDIATGTTTVFNPFIANELLWWFEWTPKARIAKLIHVTGNPLKKITEWIGNEKYKVELNIGAVTVPQIITLLQAALDISDDQAMNKWNMGVPYAIVAYPWDHPEIAKLAQDKWFKTTVIWHAITKIYPEEKNSIKWVWLWRSNIKF